MSTSPGGSSLEWMHGLALGDLLVRAAWPLVAVGLAIAFRKSLSSLLTRLRRLPGGAEVDPVNDQQSASAGARQVGVAGLSSTNDESAIGRLQETQTWIGTIWPAMRTQMTHFLDQQLDSMSATDREEYLRSNLLLSRRATVHLLAVRHIFGSQQEFLQAINVTGHATAAVIRSHYDRYLARADELGIESPASITQWLAYLLSFNLIAGDEFGTTITDAGKDFLIFAASTGETQRVL